MRGGGFRRAHEELAMVRVLERDPELGRDLSPRALKLASAAAVAPLLRRDQGATSFLIDEPETHAHLGLLMLDGMIVRHVSFGQLGASEFLGPGDLLRPWGHRGTRREIAEVSWEALVPTRLAALDQEFAHRVSDWPEITAALLDRAADRSDSQALQAALHQAKRVEDRVLLALWHFAGRWGQTGPEGRTVALEHITGELLARFVGSRRQSVSTALGQLTDCGAIRRRADGALTLPDEPPQLKTIAPGRRATDRKPRLRKPA
jgi:CRP-like cAMP-binding protein